MVGTVLLIVGSLTLQITALLMFRVYLFQADWVSSRPCNAAIRLRRSSKNTLKRCLACIILSLVWFPWGFIGALLVLGAVTWALFSPPPIPGLCACTYSCWGITVVYERVGIFSQKYLAKVVDEHQGSEVQVVLNSSEAASQWCSDQMYSLIKRRPPAYWGKISNDYYVSDS